LIELSPDKKNLMVFHSRRLCEVVRVTHDDGVELTFDNIVNDSSLGPIRLYGSDVLNWIEKNRFVLENRIGMLYYADFSVHRSGSTLCLNEQNLSSGVIISLDDLVSWRKGGKERMLIILARTITDTKSGVEFLHCCIVKDFEIENFIYIGSC